MVLRSRDDFDEMADEYEVFGPSQAIRADVERVVGRRYDQIEWFALEVEIADSVAEQRFRWAGGDQTILPYFRATYRGRSYTAREMGLGEFSAHFLFWILEQYREEKDLLLLLDEPDAFLPPIGVSGLLARVLRLCLERQWRAIVSSHSEELIVQAVQERGFTLLRADDAGHTIALHSVDDPSIADQLLSRPPIDTVIFCEDESASALTRALLNAGDPKLARTTSVIWGSGDGDLVALQKHLPRSPRPDIAFAVVYDGDQRARVDSTVGRWRAVFLPTESDPDTLFMTLAADVDTLARKLGVAKRAVELRLDALEGADPHDWVNGLSESFGRAATLPVLAQLWADTHHEDVEAFIRSLSDRRGPRPS